MSQQLRSLTRTALPWTVPVGMLLLWQAASHYQWLSSRIVPTPVDVFRAGVRTAASGELLRHIGVSTARAAAGFLLGGSIGFVFGLLNGVSDTAARLLNSTFQMVRNVPHLALIPLFILWFGIDERVKVYLVALGVFFPIYLNTYHGAHSGCRIDRDGARLRTEPRGAFPPCDLSRRSALHPGWSPLRARHHLAHF